jgi:hypothetical protein
MNSIFGLTKNIFSIIPLDLNKKELILYNGIIVLMF